MIKIIKQEIEVEENLKKKIEFICDFCNTKPKIINDNIKNIEHPNLSYIEPHRVIIKGITFLAFNYSITFFSLIFTQKPYLFPNLSLKFFMYFGS